MKSFLCFLLIALSTLLKGGNDSTFTVLKRIDKKTKLITTDRLGNLYLANDNFIWLFNSQGDSIGAFNSRKYGTISFVDATDPYQILVFFKDYNMVLFLDNYLSENGDPIDLQALGFDQVIMACKSRENGFWIFDQLKQKIFHLDESFRQTHESVNLSQWFGEAMEPQMMVEYNNKLYVNSAISGIFVFDHFATYLKRIPLIGLDQIQLLEDRINYLENDSFCQYNLKDFKSDCKKISSNQGITARIEKNRFFLQEKKKVTIFKTN